MHCPFTAKTLASALLLGAALLAVSACAAGDEAGELEEGAPTLQEEQMGPSAPETPLDSSFAGTVPAPEFPPGLEWINVSSPLSIQALRGKVVVLDFWTYGCINCIHMIPVLHQLEEKYEQELVVIGVHSAKFENEGDTDNIRQIVQRYGLVHPVINDNEFRVWRAYSVRAWPTFAVIDPRGRVVAIQAGEIPYDSFDRLIGGIVETFDELGEINREPLELALESAGEPPRPLLFPGKVLADEAGGRLFIADSGNHRIIVADLESYEVLDVIGSGQAALIDGAFDAAAFNTPQGMALDGDTLFVADMNNHAIRAVDLVARTVSTIAGTGRRGTGAQIPAFGERVEDPTQLDLRSPWDVEPGEDGTLYIAMAGTHQIWAYDQQDGTLRVAVGNGREALYNSTLASSELAQPSGLYYSDGLLVFADSESSSVRAADLQNDRVRTLSGPASNTLFEFGDRDGVVGVGLLQHPLGVVGAPDGRIYIADTYNNRIKVFNPASEVTSAAFGAGGPGGFRDGSAREARFYEPGGLDYAAGRLYVADTNNHAIRVIDLQTSAVSTVTFPNPEALRRAEQAVLVVGGNQMLDADLVLPGQAVSAGAGEIVIRVALPDGFKINDLIASTVNLSADGDAVQIASDGVQAEIDDSRIVRVPVTLSEGEAVLFAGMVVYYCRTGEEALCFIDLVTVEVPLTISAGGGKPVIEIERVIVPPET